jgi:TonB-dependent receptor
VYSNENTATIRLISSEAKPTSTKATGEKPNTPGTPPTGATKPDKSEYVRLAQADKGVQTAPNSATGSAVDQAALPEVIITGVKQALATSQDVKKDAATVVDSITATDLGAFPDQSASDALQRMPGITVNRLQSNDDSTHPSGEPTNILIRGLTQVLTQFNGRDTFSADSGRGLNFNDVSPELLSRVDTYKNQTADMIEGGIAGTVNLRTRLPFDQDGHVLVGQAQGNYGDRAKQATPGFSVLGSDSLWTDVGRFGVLADYARSHVITRTQSVIDDKIDTYCSSGYGTAAHAIVNPDGSIPCTSNPFGGTGWAYAPDGIRYSQVDYDRTRIGTTLAGQYENNAESLLATVQ